MAYRTARLRDDLGHGRCEILDDASSRAVWRAIRNLAPLSAEPADAVWRISVRPSAGPAVLRTLSDAFGAQGYLDWGGGLVWIAAPATVAAHAAVEAAVTAAGGTWLLMRAA